MLVVTRADNGPGLRQGGQQFLLEMLSQAAGNDQLFSLLRQLHQGAHGFSPGVLDKTAGVHHHHCGVPLIRTHPVTSFRQKAKHVFGVHPIFFATQVCKGDRGVAPDEARGHVGVAKAASLPYGMVGPLPESPLSTP